MSNAKHSSKSQCHYTPREIIADAREVLGGIDLDPASDAFGNTRVGAREFFTKEDDGLKQAWDARALFINPPGGRAPGTNKSLPGLFWKKLVEEHGRWFMDPRTLSVRDQYVRGVASFIWIGFSNEQLSVLQKYAVLNPLDFAVCVFKERICFVDANDQPQGDPTHANFVCYGGARRNVFEGVFSKYGKVKV